MVMSVMLKGMCNKMSNNMAVIMILLISMIMDLAIMGFMVLVMRNETKEIEKK